MKLFFALTLPLLCTGAQAESHILKWDPFYKAYYSDSVPAKEVSSAARLPDGSMAYMPDSPNPGQAGDELVLKVGQEPYKKIKLSSPFKNEDVESMSFDPQSAKLYLVNAGSVRSKSNQIDVFSLKVNSQATSLPVNKVSFQLPKDYPSHQKDFEASFIKDGRLYMVSKPKMDSARVLSVDLDSATGTSFKEESLNLMGESGFTLNDWFTDAQVFKDPNTQKRYLYLLGYKGLYRCELKEGAQMCPEGFKFILEYPTAFGPSQDKLSEALLITALDEGQIIREEVVTGLGKHTRKIDSAIFEFKGANFVHNKWGRPPLSTASGAGQNPNH